jgi:hypothetical protein
MRRLAVAMVAITVFVLTGGQVAHAQSGGGQGIVPSATETATPIFTATATTTPEGTATETPPATATQTPLDTETPLATATFTAVATSTATSEPEGTATETPTATATEVEATATFTPVFTATATSSPEGTATETPTATATEVVSTATPTEVEATATFTPEFTATATSSPEGTATETPEATATLEATETPTATPIFTATTTSTPEGTASETPTPTPTPTVTPTQVGDDRRFIARLNGENEVPPVDTDARGRAVFKLNKNGVQLRYDVFGRDDDGNIEGITAVHIHCGAPGVNGPIVVFLFGPDPDGAEGAKRIIAQGTVTPADVMPVPDSPECPGGIADFDDLIAKMRAGQTYINVHTLDHPSGEIRGQIEIFEL